MASVGSRRARRAFYCPQKGTSVSNQSRLFKRGEHLLAVGLEFQFPGEVVRDW
jgi:hypothetical protein